MDGAAGRRLHNFPDLPAHRLLHGRQRCGTVVAAPIIAGCALPVRGDRVGEEVSHRENSASLLPWDFIFAN